MRVAGSKDVGETSLFANAGAQGCHSKKEAMMGSNLIRTTAGEAPKVPSPPREDDRVLLCPKALHVPRTESREVRHRFAHADRL
jgi:hypothetical protein